MQPIARGLVVSCQAEVGSPFHAPHFLQAFAKAAELGGAVGVRLCGVDNIAAVRPVVTVPIVGITKTSYASGEVLITATIEDARACAAAGADVVALDATRRRRPDGTDPVELLRRVRREVKALVMADVATLAEGLAAAPCADYVSTTLAGYTDYTQGLPEGVPDLALVRALAERLPAGQVVCEGRIWTPEQAAEALRLGAHAVVVGTAITRPMAIVQRFVRAMA